MSYDDTSDGVTPTSADCVKLICDMIKRSKSDVGNIDFELQAKRGDQF